MHIHISIYLLTLIESGVRVTSDAGYLCANFSLPTGLSVLDLGPMYAIDRQTDVRRASSFNAPTGGGIISLMLCVLILAMMPWLACDHLCYVTSVKYLGVVPDASIFGCLMSNAHIK